MENKDYIPLNECKDRALYRVEARNFTYAVYSETQKGFIGLQESAYLELEYHYDTGAPHGTVKPIEMLETIPIDICVGKKYPTIFERETGREIERKAEAWYFVDTLDYCGEDTTVHAVGNHALYAWLLDAVTRHIKNMPKTLRIVYDPDKGVVVPDNKVMDFVKDRIKVAQESKLSVFVVIVGSEILVQAFRLAAADGSIDSLVVETAGKTYEVCDCGGFCDYPNELGLYSGIFEKILKYRVDKKTCKGICRLKN